MNGLLNETVLRVVLMVKVISPGRTCIARTPANCRPGSSHLSGGGLSINSIGDLPSPLAKLLRLAAGVVHIGREGARRSNDRQPISFAQYPLSPRSTMNITATWRSVGGRIVRTRK